MLLAQSYSNKDSFLPPIDKENANINANNQLKKSNFVIKKPSKPVPARFIGKNTIQPSFDQAEAQALKNSRLLNAINPNPKESWISKRFNVGRVKRALTFDKENQNIKNETETVNKVKVFPAQKGRSFYISKDANKETMGNEKAKRTTFLKTIKGDNERQEPVFDQFWNTQEDNDEYVSKIITKSRSQDYPTEDDIVVEFEAEKVHDTMKEYSNDIIESLKEKDNRERLTHCLGRHKISPMLRSKMVDWMIEVMCSYKCSDQTFFIAVDIMDNFFQRTDLSYGVNDLHLVGVTSMFMAAKFEEIYPMKLEVIHEKIAHRKLSIETIINKEGEILQTLGFNITPTTTYDFITNALFQLNLQESFNPELCDYLKRVCVYLTKANAYDYELISEFTHCQLAASTLFVAFKVIEQIEAGFPLTTLMAQVSSILKVDDDSLYLCASKILNLAKTFDYVYPNFQNLKKYHFIGVSEQALSSTDVSAPKSDVSYDI